MKKKRKNALLISGIAVIFLILFSYPIYFFGTFFISYIKYRDRSAIVKLDEQTTIKIVMKCKYFPSQNLIISVYDSAGNELFCEDIAYIVGLPTDYIDSKDQSWKRVELIKDENGTKTFEAIWGTILLESNGVISIYPRQP